MTVSEGRPVVRRFIIKRHPLPLNTRSPWVLRDRSRPAYLGHFASFELAIAAVDAKLSQERGIPMRAEYVEEAAREKYGDRAGTTAERVTVEEAAALQSYPAGFTFAGTKTKQFLQIGNAVPPLLAEAILQAVTEPEGRES